MWTLVANWCTPTTLFVLLNVMIGTIAVTSRFGGPRNDHQRMYHRLDSGATLRRAPSLLERVKSLDFSVYRYEQQPPPPSETEFHPQLVRAPSLLERVRSFNFSLYAADEPPYESVVVGAPTELHVDGEGIETAPQPQVSRTPSLLERVKSIKLSFHRSDPLPSESTGGGPDRDGGPGEEMMPESEGKRAPTTRSKKLKKSMSEKEAFGPGEDADAVESRRPQTMRETKSETMSFEDDEEVDAKADDFINRFKQQLKLQRLDSLLRYSRGGVK